MEHILLLSRTEDYKPQISLSSYPEIVLDSYSYIVFCIIHSLQCICLNLRNTNQCLNNPLLEI